jgi:hypothetical protein
MTVTRRLVLANWNADAVYCSNRCYSTRSPNAYNHMVAYNFFFSGNGLTEAILHCNEPFRNCHLSIHDATCCRTNIDIIGEHNKFDVQHRALAHAANGYACALLE